MTKVSVCRIAHFNAAHRLFNPAFSDEKNLAVFGKCANPNFHGHNYTLEVWVKGAIDPATGYVMDLKILKNIIEEEIENRFDHKNLNLDTEEFKSLIPTAENICVVCWQLLRNKIDSALELKVRLSETERNLVEYSGN
jgi:6-pyruvoyltetrahydropterin/6-carboxytetrahydropterin synthase